MSEFDDVVDKEDGALGDKPLERQLSPETWAWLARKHWKIAGMPEFLAESDRLSSEA